MSISQIQIKSFQHLLAKRQQTLNNNTLPVGLPDAAVYYYVKEASFLSKKEQRWTFYLFQGLNTNPQNLSIFMRDEAQKQNKSGNKQKLSKGIFAVYDLFGKADVIIQISIPGNLRIFKFLQGKKELVSSEEMDLMYLSSVFRSMYQNNLPWGRYYLLFHQSKNYFQQLKKFYQTAFQVLLKKDITIPGQFQSCARIKGSHGCSLVFNYIKERKLVRHSIDIIEELIQTNEEYGKCYKFRILLAELYQQFGKTSKSLDQINKLLQKTAKEPYLRYYQAKYLYASSLYEQSLIITNSIVQYNQFQIWILLARLHHELKNFGDLLICLNHAIKFTKIKGTNKNLDQIYRSFQELGKIKYLGVLENIENNPKVLVYTDSPLNIPVKQVEEKNKFLIEKGYWRLNPNQRIVYEIMQDLRYRLQSKKFQELLQKTFEDNIPKFQVTIIKKGLISTHLQDPVTQKITHQHSSFNRKQEAEEDLPEFLKQSVDKVEQSVNMKAGRNLSIIPQIQSVIQNSNYEQKQKQRNNRHVKYKREVQQGLFKIVQLLLSQTEFQKAQYENNVGKILQVYNKMRTSSKFNNYYADRMFKIFVQVENYRSIIVLMAETLDFMEQKGIRKIDKLPYWMHKYLFFIIEEKGLKYLNDMLQKLNFYDEAVIDTIQIAKNWKMKGVSY